MNGTKGTINLIEDLHNYIHDRLREQLVAEGHRKDVIEACMPQRKKMAPDREVAETCQGPDSGLEPPKNQP